MQQPPYATNRRVGCVMWLSIAALILSGIGLIVDITQELAWDGRIEQLNALYTDIYAPNDATLSPSGVNTESGSQPANESLPLEVAREAPAAPAVAVTGVSYDQICGVNESDMTDPQIRAHAEQFVGQRIAGWQAWVYDVTDYGTGQYDLQLAMEERGFLWNRDVVIENINSTLATSLNVEQQVTLSGRIDRVDTDFEVMCNPIYVTDATITLADGTEIPAALPAAVAVVATPMATSNPPTPTVLPTATPLTYIGDMVTLDGYSLQVFAIEDPATRPGMFYEPEAGKRLVAVEFAVGNVSAEMFDSNELKAVLIDANGFLYAADVGLIEGDMELLDVHPGQVVRGWTGFLVPDGAVPASFKYDFDYGEHFIQVGLNRR